MADMRSCSKMGCRWPAAATLSYRYATAEVWLSDLGEHHPATHDLCPHHADALRIPRGWTLIDDRRPAEAVREPSAAEIVERVTTLRRSVDAMLDAPAPAQTRRSRYESLLDSLPTYDPPAAEEDAPTGTAPAAVVAPPAVLVPVGVSHEMAPIVRELARAHPVLPAPHADPRSGTADDAPIDGAPVDPSPIDRSPIDPGAVHRTGLRGAVVLSLPLRTPGGDDGEAG